MSMTTIEAAMCRCRAYTDDDGNGVIFVLDTSDRFGAIKGLDGKWELGGFTEGGLAAHYHLIRNYDEVLHLLTAARTSLSL
jgi:hypothetical protein